MRYNEEKLQIIVCYIFLVLPHISLFVSLYLI